MFIIGQRLNLAGNISLSESIKAGQEDLIRKEVLLQEQAGADALDVHISYIKPDRGRFMAYMIDLIKSVTRLPLSIDDTDVEVVEAGIKRAGNGSLINTPVDLSQNLDRICSLAFEFKDSEFFIVPLKDKKIPDDLHSFFETSTEILRIFESRGISKKRVSIDALLFCLKEVGEKVLNTLDRIKMLKEEMGVKSVIGLSNLTYQMKQKEPIHAAFLRLARKSGLDSVICNPLEKSVMEVATSSNPSTEDKSSFLKLAKSILN